MILETTAAFSLAILLIIFTGGCGVTPTAPDTAQVQPGAYGSQQPASLDDSERVYRIPVGGDWGSGAFWVIDRDGNEVADETDSGYMEYELTDLATGEPAFQVRQRQEVNRDEGFPRAVMWRSLWDMDGNMLIDWELMDYRQAFGEYIIRMENWEALFLAGGDFENLPTALYHVPTGREMFAGTFNVGPLDNGTFLLSDQWGTALGIVNEAGEVVAGFPMEMPFHHVSTWNNYIIASSRNPREEWREEERISGFLLDADFNMLFTGDWVNPFFGGLRGDYIAFRNGDENGIWTIDDGVIFSVTDATIEYFDGELAIVQTGEFRGSQPLNATLVTREHEEIAGGFSWLTPDGNFMDNDPAERFIGILDGQAVIIDREGNVIASSEYIPNVRNIWLLSAGLYTFGVEDGAVFGAGLLGPNMETLAPAGRYSYFGLAPGLWSDEEIEAAGGILLQAGREIGNPRRPIHRMDILDAAGNVIVDNVTVIFEVGPDRIALRRGFNVGLMDWSGNWITSRTIFSNQLDD